MGSGPAIPSHALSEKVSRSLAGKKIVAALFLHDWLKLDMEDGSIVRIHATEWCSLNRVKYGGPFLEITKIKPKKKTDKDILCL